jgi:sarcosine oxidase subunit gamma
VLAERLATLHEITARRGQVSALGLPPMGVAVPLWGGVALPVAPGTCLLVGGTPPVLPREVGSVVDQSGGFVVLHFSGPAVVEALARICRLDLHDAAFPVDAVARTPMAQVTVVLHRTGPTAFELLVPSTLAVSFTHALLGAAVGFGCTILPPLETRDHP